MNAVHEPQRFAGPAAAQAAQSGKAYHQRALADADSFLAAVDAIAPVLRAGREVSEREGRVPDASVQAMAQAGVFRCFTPLRYGGLELSPAAFFESIVRIARCDSAAAWIAGQIGCHSLEVAAMEPQMQEDFWGRHGPDARASSSYAPLGKTVPVPGGYQLDGTWTFSSGVDHAHFVLMGGGERNFLVPVQDLEIDHRSWNVQGLRGTGSKAVTARQVFVPQHRVHLLADVVHERDAGYALNTSPLYTGVSWLSVFYSTATCTVIGTALEGLHVFMEQSRTRYTKMGTGAKFADNPFLHLKLADALTRVNDTHRRHIGNWHRMFEQACQGAPASLLERLRVRFESADSNATCFDALHDIWPLVGALSSQSSNPLQQIFRDLMSARTHGTAGKELTAAAYSRALLGLPPPEFAVLDFAAAAYLR